MLDVYTPEQIEVVKTAVDYYSKRYGDNKPANGLQAILSALSTAERERDALKAQVAELEARLQGAADRGVECLMIMNCYPKTYRTRKGCSLCPNCAKLRAAILGEKKEA